MIKRGLTGFRRRARGERSVEGVSVIGPDGLEMRARLSLRGLDLFSVYYPISGFFKLPLFKVIAAVACTLILLFLL